jgi:glycosyltransferase involved in cell wall biosynthesis
VVVPNGVNYKHFSQNYSSIEIDEIKNKLQKKEGDVFLITTSRLVKKNGIDDVIKAMKFMPSNVYFLVYGLGPDLDMLKNLAKSEGVEGKVRFLGQLAHAEMPKYLKSSDIFIRPSLSEGFGISFVEAMAAEVPVIATQVGGIADFLYDPEINSDKEPTGRAVKVHDPEGIARQVRAYLENPELTKRIIANAKMLVFERYDWNLIAKQMKENVFDYVFK